MFNTREARALLIAAGLCPCCGGAPAPGRKWCRACAAGNRARVRRHRDRAAGRVPTPAKCPRCGK